MIMVTDQMDYFERDGIRIAFQKCGKGRPLLMIHGNGEDHTIFHEAVELLKESFTCYLVDSRGHGESSSVDELHYSDMAEDCISLMELLDLKDVAFYGFSDGGIIGILVALRSSRITDLIVSGANIHPLGVNLKTLLDIKREYRKTNDPKLKLMITEPDISREELSVISARTLVLAGEHDLITYPHTRMIAKSIPGSRMRILRGEDHGSYITHSDKIAVLLLKWLRQDGSLIQSSDDTIC